MAPSNYLKRVLWKLFGGSPKRPAEPAGAALDFLGRYHSLSRFILEKHHFSRGRVKPSAFLPSSKDLSMSALWIDELTEPEIWQMGDDVAGKPRNRQCLARADFDSSAVSEVKLVTEPDPEPPRHVVLRGWPTEKDARIAVALDLCARSMLRVREITA
jgi:hypothetical protein